MAAARAPARPRLRWRRASVAGRSAFYAEAGDGPPIVFLHGWGLSNRTYARALPGLAAAGARVIAPALPGFGRSDDLRGPLTWDGLAHWLDDLLRVIGVAEPAVIVGHSFGGAVATMFAWHHPDRVRGVVLVNSIGGSVWKSGAEQRSLAERPLWDWGLHLPTEWARKGYRRVLPVVARDFAENVVRHPTNLMRAARLARDADLRTELNDLRDRQVPITILWGQRDRVLPESAFLGLCEALGMEGALVPGGHSWLIADPKGFGEVMTNSLAIHALVSEGPVATADGNGAAAAERA